MTVVDSTVVVVEIGQSSEHSLSETVYATPDCCIIIIIIIIIIINLYTRKTRTVVVYNLQAKLGYKLAVLTASHQLQSVLVLVLCIMQHGA